MVCWVAWHILEERKFMHEVRPSSDVKCFCHVELNCTKARLQHGRNTTLSDSGAVIHLLKPRNYSPRYYPRKRNPPKIYQFCLAQQKYDVWIAAVSESCRMQSLSNFVACRHNPVRRRTSTVLWSKLILLSFVWHGGSTTSELGRSLLQEANLNWTVG